MAFDTCLFRLPLAKPKWQSLVHQFAVRLRGDHYKAELTSRPQVAVEPSRHRCPWPQINAYADACSTQCLE
jgi:hypothetical protein